MQAIIREAAVTDLAQMYQVTLAAHRQAYTELIPAAYWRQFLQYYTFSQKKQQRYVAVKAQKLKDKNWQIWVAEMDSEIVGYVTREWQGNTSVYVRGLFVSPAYFGQGIGTALLKKSFKDIGPLVSMYLSVIEDNHPAVRLYLRHGFERIGYDQISFYGARRVIMKRISN